MTYELKLEKFTGPLEKLLELIEERKMEIAEVSLAAVTDDFLDYLRKLEKVEMPMLADFIVVASRLVLLKSRSLLPGLELSGEEEEDIHELEWRLRIYKEIKPMIKFLAAEWHKRQGEFSRPYFLEGGFSPMSSAGAEGIFFPGSKLNLEELAGALTGIIQSFKSLNLETETIKEKIISLEEKIQEVMARLQSRGEDSFQELAEAKHRAEVIIIFLAILHLAREKLVQLEQKGHFSDIMITKRR